MLLKGGRSVHRLGKESAVAKVKLKGRSLTRGRENQYSVEDVEELVEQESELRAMFNDEAAMRRATA